MKLLLELRFDGRNYHGWQVQKNAPSVQKTLQNAAEELLKRGVKVTGCSRTDAGVHALSYFCTLESTALDGFPADKLPAALNVLLPGDVAVKRAAAVNKEFHPRYDALAKEYIYRIYNGPVRDPFLDGRVWMLPGRRIDEEKMNDGAKALIGVHDFTSFCAAGGKIEDKTREVYACEVKRQGDEVLLRISADGFLYNMVRIVAGTLYDCAAGRKEDVRSILGARDRARAGRTAPPQGLYLNRVLYEGPEADAFFADARKAFEKTT